MDASERHVKLALWTGAFAGPVAFAADLEARYALVKYVCLNHAGWLMWVITATALLVTALGAFFSWWGWRLGNVETGFSPSGRAEARPHIRAEARPHIRAEARPHIRFMAIGGLFIGGMFALAIIAMAIPDLFLRACD